MKQRSINTLSRIYQIIFLQILLFLILQIFFAGLDLQPVMFASAEVDKEVLGSAPGRFNSIVADDIDDDGRFELVFGNYDGYVTVLEYRDYDFHEEWQSKKIGHRVWGITVADFVGDETKEIIAGNGDGEIYVFDAKTHEQVWYTEDLVRDVHGLFVSDLGTNSTRYLLAGTGYKTDNDLGTLYIFTENSTKPVAEIGQFDNRFRGLGVGDVDGDGELEIVFGSGVAIGENAGEGYVHVYDIKSVLNHESDALEWKSKNLKGCCVALELVDFNGDGYPEIVVGNGYRYQAGWVRILTYDKNTQNYIEYWKSPDIGPKPYGLAVGDIDDDGNLEIVVGNQPGYIYIFEQSSSGIKEEWKSGLLGTDILGIYIADVDDDGQVEIVASHGGYTGKGDYTSGYTDPHIYIIDGKTHEIEIIIGETHWLGFALQFIFLILIILFLVVLNLYALYHKRLKTHKRLVSGTGKPFTSNPSPSKASRLPFHEPAPTPAPALAVLPAPASIPASTPTSKSTSLPIPTAAPAKVPTPASASASTTPIPIPTHKSTPPAAVAMQVSAQTQKQIQISAPAQEVIVMAQPSAHSKPTTALPVNQDREVV